MKKPHPFREVSGFSLVEVALALGILSLCMIPLMGLLPVGLNATKSSREQAGAVVALELIAGSLRQASAINQDFSANGAYSNIIWQKGSGTEVTMANLSVAGIPTTDAIDQRLAAYVQVRPPAPGSTATTAQISVAWPKSAVYDAATAKWQNAQGAVSSWLIFLPGEK